MKRSETLWYGYGMGRIKAFYNEASAYVRVDGELSEFSYKSASETRTCDVVMAVKYIYG